MCGDAGPDRSYRLTPSVAATGDTRLEVSAPLRRVDHSVVRCHQSHPAWRAEMVSKHHERDRRSALSRPRPSDAEARPLGDPAGCAGSSDGHDPRVRRDRGCFGKRGPTIPRGRLAAPACAYRPLRCCSRPRAASRSTLAVAGETNFRAKSKRPVIPSHAGSHAVVPPNGRRVRFLRRYACDRTAGQR